MADSPIFADSNSAAGGKPGQRTVQVAPGATVIIQQGSGGGWGGWAMRGLGLALALSVFFNLGLLAVNYRVPRRSRKGRRRNSIPAIRRATQKIAVIEMSGTIMPPYTERMHQTDRKGDEGRRASKACCW